MEKKSPIRTALEIVITGRNKEADELRALQEKHEKHAAGWAGFGVIALYAAAGLGCVVYAMHQDLKRHQKRETLREKEEDDKRLAEKNKSAEQRLVDAVTKVAQANDDARSAALQIKAERRAVKEREAAIDAMLEQVLGTENGKGSSTTSKQS